MKMSKKNDEKKLSNQKIFIYTSILYLLLKLTNLELKFHFLINFYQTLQLFLIIK